MKVVCVNNKIIKTVSGKLSQAPMLIEGSVYTVKRETEYGYFLNEAEASAFYGFDKKRFIPLSDIDETEFVRNYNKQKV